MYGEGSSLDGYYVSDYVVIGEEMQDYFENKEASDYSYIKDYIKEERAEMLFGCTDRETKLFLEQYPDGIIGLNPSIDIRNPPNIIDY